MERVNERSEEKQETSIDVNANAFLVADNSSLMIQVNPSHDNIYKTNLILLMGAHPPLFPAYSREQIVIKQILEPLEIKPWRFVSPIKTF
ncbi:CLUMA_CG004184, isoform A [Clunio marinus]|uniref:CLUMA_CG004184, isoform A n=1 Tax=Clunio marinus TaxID=568069 RepID=A0A1J1HSS5_9DIPT|nr:CLUMA_CG004184, isoform A [Clunio marinus]